MGTHKTSLKFLFGILLVVLSTTIPICNSPRRAVGQPPAPTDLGVFTTPRLLSVTKSGTGSGTVTAVGVNCGTNCFQNYEDGTVTVLTASPNSGSTFAGWSGGGCSGTGTCSVTMSSAQTVIATFNATANVFASRTGISTGSCSSSAPCDVFRALQVVTCGQTIQLNNDGGLGYKGARYMLDFVSATVPNKTCTAASPITVSAETDGGVFIDGEFLRAPFKTSGNSYWYFEGFDAGNAGPNTSPTGSNNGVYRNETASDHLILRRITLSNVAWSFPMCGATCINEHIFAPNGTSGSIFVDLAIFGTGRTPVTEYQAGTGNVYRRIWLRYEGYPTTNATFPDDGTKCAPTPVVQYAYDSGTANSIWENIITVHDPEQYNTSTFGDWSTCSSGVPYKMAAGRRDASTGVYQFKGWISYGYDGFTTVGKTAQRTSSSPDGAWMDDVKGRTTIVDYFLDARSQAFGRPFTFSCPGCAGTSADRITGIQRTAGQASDFSTFGSSTPTNAQDCFAGQFTVGASLGGCPSFYTGDTPGTGARNCFQYQDGTLDTGTKLWPWRMDDRIKAALARANAAGRGGSALAGVAGSGGTSTWAAGTVTSEIVSRYGAIPAACVR